MDALGRHVLVEFFGCSAEILTEVSVIENAMVNAATEAGATIINSTFHHFSPFGVSGVVVIQESHLAVHTWPEYQYAAVDLFTCGQPVDPWVSYDSLKKAFKASHGSSMEIRRGQKNLLPQIKTVEGTSAKEAPPPKFTRNIWFTERNDNIALSLRHQGDPLFREISPFQKIEVYDTLQYGKMLTCDGMIMCAEKDEHVYHEMISHVPLLSHTKAEKILVIGGGDGGTVRELLKHNQVKNIVLVEIDSVVIEASKKYLPSIAAQLDHDLLDIKIADGIAYVKDAPDANFDIVIVDSTDPVGPAEGLFTEDFYRQVYRILTPDGVMVTQSESPRFNIPLFKDIYHTYHKVFEKNKIFCYLAFIPTYPTGMWSFSYCSKGKTHPCRDLDPEKARIFSNQQKLRYYNEEVHRAAFSLPGFVKEMLDEAAGD